jgi:hypothetical protein
MSPGIRDATPGAAFRVEKGKLRIAGSKANCNSRQIWARPGSRIHNGLHVDAFVGKMVLKFFVCFQSSEYGSLRLYRRFSQSHNAIHVARSRRLFLQTPTSNSN